MTDYHLDCELPDGTRVPIIVRTNDAAIAEYQKLLDARRAVDEFHQWGNTADPSGGW